MSTELKEAVDKVGRAFEAFKEHNDKRLAEIEARGKAAAETEQAVAKANAHIDELSASVKKIQAHQIELENANARANLTGTREGAEKERLAVASFLSFARGRRVGVDEVTAGDLEAIRAYKPAFEKYCRTQPEALGPDIRAALSVGVDPAGGYLVPPDTTGRLIEFAYRTSPLRQFATVETTSRDKKMGMLDLDEAGAGWVGETEARGETTTPDIGSWEIPVKELQAEPQASQQSLEDAEWDLEAWLVRKGGEKMGRVENTAFVGGNTPKRPRGFTTYPFQSADSSKATWGRIKSFKTGVSGAFAAQANGSADVLIDMITRLKSPYRQGAAWAMNTLTLAAARKLKDVDGNYLLIPNFGQGVSLTFLGYPVAELEDIPDIAANSYSLYFGNWREAYTIVDRRGITLLRDPYTKKGFVKFYMTKRVGGDLINFDALFALQFAV